MNDLNPLRGDRTALELIGPHVDEWHAVSIPVNSPWVTVKIGGDGDGRVFAGVNDGRIVPGSRVVVVCFVNVVAAVGVDKPMIITGVAGSAEDTGSPLDTSVSDGGAAGRILDLDGLAMTIRSSAAPRRGCPVLFEEKGGKRNVRQGLMSRLTLPRQVGSPPR